MIKVLKVEKNIKKTAKIASDSIKQGKILILPTDTVYGLVADAASRKAVGKIFQIKGRQKNKALPFFVKDIKTAKNLAHINKNQEKFLEKVWPGKVTAVLKRTHLRQGFGGRGKRYKIYGVGKNTIALRVPKHQLLMKILDRVDRPLTGTSANIAGKLSLSKIKDVLKKFKNQKNQPDLIISAGDLQKSKSSTVIDLTTDPFKVSREGAVSKKEILRYIKSYERSRSGKTDKSGRKAPSVRY